jgi:hypothetical protein
MHSFPRALLILAATAAVIEGRGNGGIFEGESEECDLDKLQACFTEHVPVDDTQRKAADEPQCDEIGTYTAKYAVCVAELPLCCEFMAAAEDYSNAEEEDAAAAFKAKCPLVGDFDDLCTAATNGTLTFSSGAACEYPFFSFFVGVTGSLWLARASLVSVI